ncbi:hypothetical protein M430DRAFT_68667, partial [Amorphotheca resinae ATCC 22711]
MILGPLTDLHMASHPSSTSLKPFIPLWPSFSLPGPLATQTQPAMQTSARLHSQGNIQQHGEATTGNT